MLYVDARQFSTSLAAIIIGISARELERSTQRERRGGRDALSSQVASVTLSTKLKGTAKEAKLRLVEPPTLMQRNAEMLASAAELAEAQGLYIFRVVDEANLAFPMPLGTF